MPLIVIRLADILTSPSDPVDLTALPPDKTAAHVRRIYDFLPGDAQVSVKDEVATMKPPGISWSRPSRSNRTIPTHGMALRWCTPRRGCSPNADSSMGQSGCIKLCAKRGLTGL